MIMTKTILKGETDRTNSADDSIADSGVTVALAPHATRGEHHVRIEDDIHPAHDRHRTGSIRAGERELRIRDASLKGFRHGTEKPAETHSYVGRTACH